ncbi:hypothetical protein K458DRAFT_418560 [Lentithecium fluviatile CBS 122367]|uniref:Uncharacterized protein n=1 Tax=Lentithecium fluviatile CBS 122367 TaxID=1168545 RepID=A0A6G1J029_9PLEO|nr:hypothetical protein K458DRAFT_418560 [Lentithecium fluviatile CBS 122367]
MYHLTPIPHPNLPSPHALNRKSVAASLRLARTKRTPAAMTPSPSNLSHILSTSTSGRPSTIQPPHKAQAQTVGLAGGARVSEKGIQR